MQVVVLVYLGWFRRNSVLKCLLQPKIAKNSLKTPIFGVQGRSGSSMLVPLERSSAVLVMMSSKSVSICNRFHARRANSGKITISKGGGTPLWCPRSRGITTTTEQQQNWQMDQLRRFRCIPSQQWIQACVFKPRRIWCNGTRTSQSWRS